LKITQQQAVDLARHFVGIRSELEKFFADPDNQKAYEKWYQEKYGHKLNKEAM
jgi:hypothetical protein